MVASGEGDAEIISMDEKSVISQEAHLNCRRRISLEG